METLHNKRHCNVNKKYDNKDKNDKKNNKDKKDKNTSYSTDRPMPIKVYFPTISMKYDKQNKKNKHYRHIEIFSRRK